MMYLFLLAVVAIVLNLVSYICMVLHVCKFLQGLQVRIDPSLDCMSDFVKLVCMNPHSY